MTVQSRVTYRQIVKAIEGKLKIAKTIKRTESLESLTEGIPDVPLIQVYVENGLTDSGSGSTDRTTFGGGVRQHALTVFCDVYVRQRAHIGEDMGLVVDSLDAIVDVLNVLKQPYFDVEGIKSLTWSWDRVTFIYGDPATPYTGARFTFTMLLF